MDLVFFNKPIFWVLYLIPWFYLTFFLSTDSHSNGGEGNEGKNKAIRCNPKGGWGELKWYGGLKGWNIWVGGGAQKYGGWEVRVLNCQSHFGFGLWLFIRVKIKLAIWLCYYWFVLWHFFKAHQLHNKLSI